MKLPVLNNPYNQKKISKKDLKLQITKRVKKHLAKFKTEFEYIKASKKIDKLSTEILETIRTESGRAKRLLPLTANYQAYILYYYFLFGEMINRDTVYMYEPISNRELEMLDALCEKEMDKLFLNETKIDEYKFKLIKNFVKELENKYPGSDLASSKSYSIIEEFIAHHN